MEDIEFVKLMLDACEQSKIIPIVILKTPKAGETVDNGMGVEFDLPPFAMIFKMTREADPRCDEWIFSDPPFGAYPDSKVKTFNVENITSIDGMVENLRDMDEYEVIWKNEEYKPRDPIVSKLEIQGNHLDLVYTNSYSLTVSFEEMRKYISDKSRDFESEREVFITALQEHKDFDTIVGNRYYPWDVVKYGDCKITETGLIFTFSCASKEVMWDLVERKEIEEALADVDAGRVIDHELVKERMNKIMGIIKQKYNNKY